jgi:alpha-tubulin suppressor-like RCC1 family protein
MPRGQGGTLSGFTPLSTPNAPTGLSVSTSIGSATVSFEPPADTGDAPITAFVVTAIDESTGESTGATGSSSPIVVSPPSGGTFKFRAQAVNGFGPGRLTEFVPGQDVFSGAELYAWGVNNFGRLGLNDVANRSSPVQVGALTNWAQVSAGGTHTAAITTGGQLYAWGLNGTASYQTNFLGDNTVFSRSSPVQIGALTNWAQVSAGSAHTAAVKTDGALWAWGVGTNGRLGDGTIVNRSSPVQIGALTNWAQVSAGGTHTAAITTGGQLYAWGNNGSDQIGDNTVFSRSSPVQIGALTNWAQVSAGASHTASVKTDGTMWAWGGNAQGAVGDGTVVNKSSPVQIGALTNWAQVSTGNANTAAVKTDGTMWAWGDNTGGKLGQNDVYINRSSPVQIGALTNWARVSTSSSNVSAIKTDSTLWAWGSNTTGQLGDGTVVSKSSPVQIGALTGWAQSSAGNNHTTALLGVL